MTKNQKHTVMMKFSSYRENYLASQAAINDMRKILGQKATAVLKLEPAILSLTE